MTRRRWIYDRITGEKREVPVGGTFERGNLPEDFISPIDGSIISTQIKLHDHNRRHAVVQVEEGHNQDWDVAAKKRDNVHTNKEEKARRIESIRRAMGDQL